MAEENRQIVVARVQGKKSDNTFEDIITDDAGRLQVYDPKVGSLISYAGTTTANGAVDGSTLICAALTTKPDYDGNLVIITSGAYAGQARDINGVTTGGTVTPSRAFGGRIFSGTSFVIVGITTTPAEVAAIEAKLDLATPGATFSYLDAGGEQTVFTFTPTKDTILHTIWLDLFTLTQNSTIRLKHQIDGATYRTFETFNWTTGMDDGVYFRNIAVKAGRPLQVTMQEAADEGADRNVPYYYVYEERA